MHQHKKIHSRLISLIGTEVVETMSLFKINYTGSFGIPIAMKQLHLHSVLHSFLEDKALINLKSTQRNTTLRVS